jgi:predicted phage tail protein
MAQAVKRAIRAAQAAVAEIDTQIEGVERRMRDCQQELTVLRHERDRWAKLAETEQRTTAEATEEASMAIAGPGPVDLVGEYLRVHGTAYQSEITTETGLNSGTVTHALRVLGSRHTIAATGRKRRNSPEFEWTGDREPAAV